MKIRVQIYGDHGEVLRDAALEVSIARDAMKPIDYPSPGTDAATAAIFCTPAAQRILTEDFRTLLANAMAADFLAFFASKDTEMGYPKR